MTAVYSHVLWDFNGTIYNDVYAAMEGINVLLRRLGKPEIESLEVHRENFGFPIIEYYRSLGFDFAVTPYEQLAEEWVCEYERLCADAGLNDGVRELAEKLRMHGVKQYVLSVSEEKMLHRQLDELGIAELFDGALGTGNIQAYSKVDIAIAWKERTKTEKVLMIGDSDHDFETAQAIGADCILFAGGYQSVRRLKALGCPIVDSFKAIEEKLGL